MNYKIQHRGFTMIEIILVVLIIGILMGIMSRFFVPSNRAKINTDICTNTVIGKINNFFNTAVTGRRIYASGDIVASVVQAYHLIVNTIDNTISFGIQTGTNTDVIIHDRLSLIPGSGFIDKCASNEHNVYLTGSFSHLIVNKNLLGDETIKRGMYFSGQSTSFTGELVFLFEQGPNQREYSRILFDTRSQIIYRDKCLFFPETGPCIEWSETF